MRNTPAPRKFCKDYSRTLNSRKTKHLPIHPAFQCHYLPRGSGASGLPEGARWLPGCGAAAARALQSSQYRRAPLRGEVLHFLCSYVLATWGPSETLRGASALGEKSQHLPWRSSGCTRRLVMVSHRAMISSLSSRPSRLRQPSISG